MSEHADSMRWLQLTFQSQYREPVEAILERHGLPHRVRHHRIAGRDRDGRHEGSQAFPGQVSLIEGRVPEEALDGLLEELEAFRKAKTAHEHLEAVVLPVERWIGPSGAGGDEEKEKEGREKDKGGHGGRNEAAEGGGDGEAGLRRAVAARTGEPPRGVGPGREARGRQGPRSGSEEGIPALLLPWLLSAWVVAVCGMGALPVEAQEAARETPPTTEGAGEEEARFPELVVELPWTGEGLILDPVELEQLEVPPSPEAPVVPQAPPLETRAEPLVLPAADGGDEATVVPVSRDGAILTALLNNRGLKVVSFGPRLAATGVREARGVFDPRLTAGLSHADDTRQLSAERSFTFEPPEGVEPVLATERTEGRVSLSTFFPSGTSLLVSAGMVRDDTNFTPVEYDGRWSVEVSQSLLEGFGDDVHLVRVRQAATRTAQSMEEYRAAVLDLVARVEQAYWDLALARQVVSIRRAALELAREQLEVARDLVETGRESDSAVLAARAEHASRRADLLAARGQVRARTLDLLQMLDPEGRRRGVVLEPLDPPRVRRVEPDPEASEARARAGRPELDRQRLEIADRRLEKVLAEDDLEPRLDLVASYGLTSLGRELSGGVELLDEFEFESYRLGVELGVPVFNRGAEARHVRARLAEEEAEADLARQRLAVTTEVRQAILGVVTQWPRIAATRQAVEAREEELEIERDRYEVGLATQLDVLEVQRLLTAARVDASTARVRYLQALTDLWRAEGTLLERRGVELAEARPTPGPEGVR